MEDLMYVTMRIHQFSAISSFVLLPVLFIAKKGNSFHIKFGKFLFAVSIILVVSALLTVINPYFSAYWADDIARHKWQNFLSIFGLGTAFLWWVAAFYAYFFFSAMRVWPRYKVTHSGAGRSSHWFDYILTAIALSVGVYYGSISIYQTVATTGYPRLLPMSTAFVAFGLWDLVTYVRPIRSFRVAALTHGARLFCAWWMLIVGVLIRQVQYLADGKGQMGAYTVTSIILVLFAILLFYWIRQLSSGPSKSAAPGNTEAPGNA